MHSIKFMITDTKYIEVIPESIEKSICGGCSYSNIYYINQDLNLNVLFGYTEADCFYGSFGFKGYNAVLNNKLFFDTKLRKDPGFEYNQYCKEFIKNSDVIDKYFFVDNNPLGVYPQYNSWFYNDEDGNIVFEITPFYPFHYETKKSHPDFITYKQFMKNYKPIVKMIIPKERFIEWNEQAKLADSKGFNDEKS